MKRKTAFKKISVLSIVAAMSVTGSIFTGSVAIASEKEADEVIISDENTSDGMTTEENASDERIVENFFQSEDTTETTEAGTAGNVTDTDSAFFKDIRDINNTEPTHEVTSETISPIQDNTEPENEENIQEEPKNTSGTGAIQSVEKTTANLNGWTNISGKYYYYKNNVKYTGWHYMTKAEGEKTDHWSYFGNDGAIRTGWVQLGQGTSEPDGNTQKHWSYFGDNGWLRTGWVQLGKGTSNPDGNTQKHWSYFGDNGWLRTGWAQLGRGTSNPDGYSQKHWSYFGDNGWMRTGWVQLGKDTSNPDGNSQKHWSYFGDNGWMRTGWVQFGKGTSNPDGNIQKHWSYFGDNGWLRTYWQQLGKGTPNSDGNSPAHFSYFGPNGWLVTGTKTITGKNYTFDSNGWLISGSVNVADANKNIAAPYTGKQLIPDGCYRISSSKDTGYSIDVWGQVADDGAKIWSYKNNDTAAQLYQIKHLGNNIYSIKTGSSIYASGWDISGGKAVAGAAVVQKKYTGASTQKWKIVSAGNDTYTFKPASGSLVVDIEGGKLSEGTIKLAKSTGSATQKFKLTKASGFLFRNGRKYYFNQNGDRPMIGMDVSAWSETVDWAKAKADGIEFAIIRVSHRGGQVDKYAARNMSECKRLGIPFGVYLYTTATTNAEADHEVDVLLANIKGYIPALGVFIDVEDTDTYEKAFGNIYAESARRKITDLAKHMINRVENAGYLAGIYGNEPYLSNVIYLNEMPDVRWIARYFTNTPTDTNVINLEGKGYKIWQFTGAATVKGVPNAGYSDLNTVIEKYW